jgi:type I restriction enzyme S subunit
MATSEQLSLSLLQDSNLGQHSLALMSGIETIYAVCRLGAKGIATIICGQHLLPEEQSDTGIPYITGPADFTERTAVPTRFAGVKKSLCMPGDVLLTVKGSGIGKVNLAPAFPAVIGRQLFAIRPHTQVLDQTFLWRVLQHELARLRDAVVSTTVPGIGRDAVKALAIPLPPLSEQRRIVARIEELAARIERARGLRRQAVREVETSLVSAMDAAFQPQQGWTEARIRDFCEQPQYGYTASATTEPVGPRFLRITDIQDGHVDWSRVPFCLCPKPAQYLLKPNDLVFARTGATTGKSFLIHDCPEAIFASYLIRLRVKRLVPIDYLYRYFQTSSYWAQIAGEKSGSAQPNLNGTKLASLRVPIAPPEEQQRIVAYLDGLQAKADSVSRLQGASATELDALLPAMLNKAFKGEL